MAAAALNMSLLNVTQRLSSIFIPLLEQQRKNICSHCKAISPLKSTPIAEVVSAWVRVFLFFDGNDDLNHEVNHICKMRLELKSTQPW